MMPSLQVRKLGFRKILAPGESHKEASGYSKMGLEIISSSIPDSCYSSWYIIYFYI